MILRRSFGSLASASLVALVSVLGLGVGACGVEPEEADEADLTSVSARSRELRFEGKVYVATNATASSILGMVHRQTKTAFGPLRTSDIGVNNRELKGVDPKTFKKRKVTVIDTSKPGDTGTEMLEVRYTYVDDAVVPKRMATRSSLPAAVLRPNYESESSRILKECTANDAEARDFADALWYVFEPSISGCMAAVKAEQQKIDDAKKKLTDTTKQVSKLEAERLYLPVNFALGADKTNDGKSYPEYDKLYKGGVEPGKLVISVLNGLIDHETGSGAPKLNEDPGYGEWLDTVDEVLAQRPGFTIADVEGDADISNYTLKSGKKVTNLGFEDFIAIHAGRSPAGQTLTVSQRAELDALIAERVEGTWITLELPVKVKIGSAKEKDFAIDLKLFFGHAEETRPFKFAIKNSDVFIYNGHSLIGFGPLDPKNFSKSDFPSTYQMLFIDGCVSYNYYEADYIPLKTGGTKNLDLITNAIESPSFQSGLALGQFISTLINGKQASYRELLESAEETGSGLRVVDGELDNLYDPAKKKITLNLPE